VTCEDFVKAMEDANQADLGQFRLWYNQSGTPELTVDGTYDAGGQIYELTVTQDCPPTPGQASKQPLHIPVTIGLLDPSGQAGSFRLDGQADGDNTKSQVLNVTQRQETFRFVDVAQEPIPSVLRDFSAPVRLKLDLPSAARRRLIAADSDPFNRWEAAQQYATGLLLTMIDTVQAGGAATVDTGFVDALGAALRDDRLDKALAAEILTLPSEAYLAQQMDVIDVEAIHTARELLRGAIARQLQEDILSIYRGLASNQAYTPDAAEAGRRQLRNTALAYLGTIDDPAMLALCVEQADTANNMTDRMGALSVLNDLDDPARANALDAFYAQWQDDALVIDKWFSLQAMSSLPDTLAAVIALLDHPAFSLRTPNKVRALVGAFCAGNPLRFHAGDGAGYAFLADRVLQLDPINPQVAARLVGAFGQWRQFDDKRQALMRGALERIAVTDGLSRDVYEIASKSLGGS
jgi:aminopeptidase N